MRLLSFGKIEPTLLPKDHGALFQAFESHDPARARSAMERHPWCAMVQIGEPMTADPAYFEGSADKEDEVP